MRISSFIVVIAIVLLSFSMMGANSCNSSSTGNDKSPFIGGTTGLSVSFVPNAPPAAVYDGGSTPFYIYVQLKNDGEWEVKKEDVIVRILGIDPGEFGISQADLLKQPLDDLPPSTKQSDTDQVIQGGVATIEFPEMNYRGTAISNLPSINVAAKVCYLYGTNVVSQVCVKKNPMDTNTNICTIEGYKTAFSSSGPVQVVNMHQSMVGKNKVGFSFEIIKKGTGKVYEKSTKCGLDSTPHENKVWVEVTAAQWEGMRCTGMQGGSSGLVTLPPPPSGKNTDTGLTITCTQDLDIQTDYPKAVNIKLMYDYEEDTLTTLQIKHAQI